MTQYLSLLLDFAAFALVAFGVFVIARRIETAQSVQRRLRGDAPQGEVKNKRAVSALMRPTEVKSPVLQWVQRTTLTDPEERNRMRRDLALAGFDNPAAPAIYVIGRFVIAAGLPTLFVFSQTTSATPIRGFLFVVIAVGLAVVGLILPRAVLDNRINARKTEIEHELPDALDLMVVCVEAGLGMEGAIVRVGDETHESHPRISFEFQMVSLEL